MPRLSPLRTTTAVPHDPDAFAAEVWIRLLDRMCSVPSPMRSWEQHQRHAHRDLAEMSGPQLRTDLAGVELRLLLETDPPIRDWLLGRRQAIADQLEARGGLK